VEEI
jgi:hypothetical protein